MENKKRIITLELTDEEYSFICSQLQARKMYFKDDLKLSTTEKRDDECIKALSTIEKTLEQMYNYTKPSFSIKRGQFDV